MKGLFIKEFYTINVYRKNLLLLLVVVVGMSILLPLGTSYVPVMTMMYLIIIMLNLFALDDSAKWDRYALSMPLSRLQIVAVRYLFLALLAVAANVLSFVLSAGISQVRPHDGWAAETLITNGIMTLTFLLVTSISAPLCYRFGAEKSRMALIIIFILPYVAIIWLMPIILPFLKSLSAGTAAGLIAGIIVLILAAFALSCFISTKIYAKKEF